MKYFLMVDWCNSGNRGVFCMADGGAFIKDQPHTEDEMFDILGPFDLILSPQSIPLTDDELKEYHYWRPLAEYSDAYGIASKN